MKRINGNFLFFLIASSASKAGMRMGGTGNERVWVYFSEEKWGKGKKRTVFKMTEDGDWHFI